MRRKEKEITDRREIEEIMARVSICRIGLCADDIPYIVPVNFGYRNNCIYFHSAPEGRKIEMLGKNNRVCFEIESEVVLVTNEIACGWSFKYRSVMGAGRAVIMTEREEKIRGLDILMSHYSDDHFTYKDEKLDEMVIVKIEIESITGKSSE